MGRSGFQEWGALAETGMQSSTDMVAWGAADGEERKGGRVWGILFRVGGRRWVGRLAMASPTDKENVFFQFY